MLSTRCAATAMRPLLTSRFFITDFYNVPARATTRSMTVLNKQSEEEYKKLNYTERMNKTGRPVSPHVTIYALPIVSISSITNRITGCLLSFGAAGVGLVELYGGNGAALGWMQDMASSNSVIIAAGAKFGVAFPLVYHYLAALRHLTWDKMPETLTNGGVEKTSYVLFGSSIVISVGSMFI